MEKLDAIIFDFDGTLVPTITRQYDWFRYWAENNGKKLSHVESGEEYNTASEFVEFYNEILHDHGVQRVYDLLGLPCDMNDSEHPVWAAYSKFKIERPLKLYEGMKGVLDELHARGVRLAINTTNKLDSIEKELGKEQVLQYFNPIITEDYLAAYHGAGKADAIKKPSKISLSLTLNELNLNGQKVLHVGDTLNDLISSKKVMRQYPTRFENLPVIGVSWGFEGRQKLEQGYETKDRTYHFDHIIDHPSELMPIIEDYI